MGVRGLNEQKKENSPGWWENRRRAKMELKVDHEKIVSKEKKV